MNSIQKTDTRRIVYTAISLVCFLAELVFLISFFIEMLRVANTNDWSALALIILLPLFFLFGAVGVFLSFLFAGLARRRLRIAPPEKRLKLWRWLCTLLQILPAVVYVTLGAITILVLS